MRACAAARACARNEIRNADIFAFISSFFESIADKGCNRY